MSCPSSSIRPSMRNPRVPSFIRLKQRRIVDFPQPDGPIIDVICRAGISSVIPLRAWNDPYHAFSFSTRIFGSVANLSEAAADILISRFLLRVDEDLLRGAAFH